MAESLATPEEKDLYYKQVKIRTGHTKFVPPEYFKHPEGEDLPGKLRCSTKWAAMGGGVLGLFKAMAMTDKPTYKDWTFLFVKPIVPAVGMAAAFTITTYMATNFRKKDDSVNYCLGGATAGAIFGAALKSVPHAIVGVALGGILGAYFKSLKTPLIPAVHTINSSPYEARVFDFSFTPPKKGNWEKGKPADKIGEKGIC